MERPLDVLLNELCESAEMPDQASLYHLSTLEAKDVACVREVWPRILVERRRRLTARLVELAEADFTLNFGAVFRLGLEDADVEVRTTAIEGLWEDSDVRLTPCLVECLREDEAIAVQAAAAQSLGRFILLGELEKILPAPYTLAYEALMAVCQDGKRHPEVRRRALESLAYVGNEVVVGLISDAYDAPEEKMRISAIFSMGRSADTRWASHVRRELFSPSPELRYEAARACGELQLSESVLELEELADDADLEVQEAALWALGQIGGDKAREIVERYCRDENEATRAAAEAAMDALVFPHGDLSEFLIQEIRRHDGEQNASCEW